MFDLRGADLAGPDSVLIARHTAFKQRSYSYVSIVGLLELSACILTRREQTYCHKENYFCV